MIILRRVQVSGHTQQWGKDVVLELSCDEAGLRAVAAAAEAGSWAGADIVAKVCLGWVGQQ